MQSKSHSTEQTPSESATTVEEAQAGSIKMGNKRASHHTHRSMPGVIGCLLKGFEELFFPGFLLHTHHNEPSVEKKREYGAGRSHVRGGVMLAGCNTVAEHYEKVHQIMEAITNMHGAEGLAVAGLEYRTVLCPAHREPETDNFVSLVEELVPIHYEDSGGHEKDVPREDNLDHRDSFQDEVTSLPGSEFLWSIKSVDSCHSLHNLVLDQPTVSPSSSVDEPSHCHLCHQRLFHIASNTPITEDNRKKYIADGDMFEAIADLCQDYAHDIMCEETHMEWITVEEGDDGKDNEHDGESNDHPNRHNRSRRPDSIRALVNSNHPLIETKNNHNIADQESMKGRPTVLIGTGRGKVRAGIFSRTHLMCTSIESSTALPILREANMRRLNVVIPDPNVRGERFAYDTFCKSLKKLFSSWEELQSNGDAVPEDSTGSCCRERDIYILSHSASGAQIQRCLMDQAQALVPHIRAIAFTDSTHNIQWAKSPGKAELYRLLESPNCIYFRYSNEERDGRWYLHATGEEIKTDSFWQHRFGKIRTYWAGTKEHSLTNWFAHAKIWDHFDKHLSGSDVTAAQEVES
ncbi:hypothetical protein ACA910_012879 [Epithemia clementina (nom. ined.)]